MTTTLEKAARAAYDADDGELPYEMVSQHYERVARAVLMAVREPDDRTLDAGCADGPDTNNGRFSYDDARTVFTAMIDAILNEDGK